MKILSRFAIFAVIITLSLMLGACREKGPAEKAGETIDRTVEDTRDALREAKEDTEEALK